MNDPAPENITGEKRHIFKHQINWGYVALAAAAVVVVYRLGIGVEQEKNQGGDVRAEV